MTPEKLLAMANNIPVSNRKKRPSEGFGDQKRMPLGAPASFRTGDQKYSWAPNETRPYMAAAQNYLRSQPDTATLELDDPEDFKRQAVLVASKVYSLAKALEPEETVRKRSLSEVVGYPSSPSPAHPFGLHAPRPSFEMDREADNYTRSKDFDPGYSPTVKLSRVVDTDPTLRDGYLLIVSNVPFNCPSPLRVWTILSSLGFKKSFIEALIDYADRKQPTPL